MIIQQIRNGIVLGMVYTLQASGFEACGFQDSVAFWKMMKEKKPEL